jgi:hypothetical protein
MLPAPIPLVLNPQAFKQLLPAAVQLVEGREGERFAETAGARQKKVLSISG